MAAKGLAQIRKKKGVKRVYVEIAREIKQGLRGKREERCRKELQGRE